MRSILSALFLVLAALPCLAADWPQFRGPLGNGISSEKNLPLEWNENKNIAWKQAIPGKGWSSPSLSQGRLYLTTAVLDEADKAAATLSQRAICLSAKDGQIIWNTKIFSMPASEAKPMHPKNSHASPTPLVENGRVYVHFGHQGTACLDLDGKILWKTQELK